MHVITCAIDLGDGVFIGGMTSTTPLTIYEPMINTELTLSQLSQVSGSGAPKNQYAKLDKTKLKKKEIKPCKPLTLKDAMNGGASPGPFLPGPDHISETTYMNTNSMMQWM